VAALTVCSVDAKTVLEHADHDELSKTPASKSVPVCIERDACIDSGLAE